jgi:hypothetical protein
LRFRISFKLKHLQQVGGFLLVLKVSSTNKTDRHDMAEILFKVTLNTITINPTFKIKQLEIGTPLRYFKITFPRYLAQNKN